MLANVVLALFAAASVNAISITSPAKDSSDTTFKAGVATTIEWTSVNTDPDSFDIVVQIPSPFSTKTIAEGIETSAGSYSFTPDASLVGDDEYVINFVDPKTDGILAQSGKFEVEQGSGNAAASSAASGAASSAATSKAAASGVTSAASPSGSAATNASGASGNSTAAIPNASATPAGSGANALVPSLALVGAAVVAAVL